MAQQKHSIISSQEVEDFLEKNLKKIADLIENTYGPFGKNIILSLKKSESIELVKNGSSIINQLRTLDPLQNLLFLILEDSFQKINNIAGDGTKTFFLITSFLVLNGLKYTFFNQNLLETKLGIIKALNYALLILNDRSLPVYSKNVWKKIVQRFIPDEDNLHNLFFNAFDEIGKSGQLRLMTQSEKNSYLEIERGMQISRGFFSPYFVTDTEKMVVDFKNPYILISNQKICLNDGVLLKLLERIIYEKRPIVIISNEIDEQALSTLILNKINGVLDIAYIKIPNTFSYDKTILEDLALYTKAKLINSVYDWKNFSHNDFGQAQRILLSKTKSIFWSLVSTEQDFIKKKCQELKQQILLSDSDYENEKRESRRKNLSGSTALIHIGGVTDLEANDRRTRVEKGLVSAKSCLYEGILPGGGFSFINLTEELENWTKSNLYGESKSGADLVIKSLIKPIQVLLLKQTNTQKIIPEYITSINEIKKLNDVYSVYDIKNKKQINFIEVGEIDSFKTLKVAIQTITSLTYSLLSISNIVI